MATVHSTQYEDGTEDAGYDGEPQEDTHPDLPDFEIIVGAPDLTALIKRPQSANAKDYTKKIGAAFKTVTIGALQAGNFPDAATILWHGPGVATALGTLCDENDRVAQAVDMLTSPSNPWSAFILASLPLISQMLRNHEKEIHDIPRRWNMGKQARAARRQAKQDAIKPEPRFHIRIGRRKIPVRFNFRIPFVKTFVGGVRSQTQEPNVIAARVFMDPGVQRSLEKLGITFRAADQ